jgi:hypothetical protein
MVNCCIVPQCFSRGNRGYFAFPKDEIRRQLWFENCGISKSAQIKKHHCVCYHHFNADDITTKKNGMSLSKSKNYKFGLYKKSENQRLNVKRLPSKRL